MLLYVRNSIPSRYNVPLIDSVTLQALVDEGLDQAAIAEKVGRSQGTVCRDLKIHGIGYTDYRRKPAKPKRAGNDKGRFGRNVRLNYRKATSWDLLGPGLLMEDGRLTRQGEVLWPLKVGKAYGRRRKYPLNPVGCD